MEGAGAAGILPIREVSTYQKGWTIRGRVTGKSAVRSFGKSGEGRVFHCDVLDAGGSEIRANFFNQAAEQCFATLEKGKCYTFSRGTVRIANLKFNNTGHKYELVFDKLYEVEPAEEDSSISDFRLAATDLKSLRERQMPCKVDLCGIVTEASATMSLVNKEGVAVTKRDVTLADDTGRSLSVVLWEAAAKEADAAFQDNPVLALKKVYVKEWQGTLKGSLLSDGDHVFAPAIPETARLRQWWASGGSSQALVPLSGGIFAGPNAGNKTVNMQEAMEAIPQIAPGVMSCYTVLCRLHSLQTKRMGEPMPFSYLACQETAKNDRGQSYVCNRKVDEKGFCQSCDRVVKSEPKLQLRCHFSDCTDSSWLGTFHDPSVELLEMDGTRLREIEEAEGREALEAVMERQCYARPLQVMIRAKRDAVVTDKFQVAVYDACPLDLGERGREMLEELKGWLRE